VLELAHKSARKPAVSGARHPDAMSVPRGPATRRIGARRAQIQAESVGSDIAMARAEHAWTRKEASRRAGVSPDTQRRVEAGDPGVSVLTVCAVGAAVGIDVVVKGYRGRRPSLRDSGQLEMAEQLCALAHPSWKAELELPAGAHGEACDIGFLGPQEIVDTEVDRLMLDFQGQYRRNVAKRDYLAARHQRPVRLVMVVEDTERNRAALAPHLDFIRSVLPASTREVLKALRTGEPLGRDGLVWFRRRAPPRR
jgi:hypothetical protein